LDAASLRAHLALAFVYFHRHELDAFVAESERAIALNPNTYQAPGCQEAHVPRAPGLIGPRGCSGEMPGRLSVP
jgi:hypothetical protein